MYCPEDIDESVDSDEQVDESTLVDAERLEYIEEGEGFDSSWL